MNAFLVDDEAASRNILKYMLREHCPEINIVGESDNPDDAILSILKQKIDILFLDVQFANGKLGFEILEELKNFQGHIVFVSAHEQYALQAFHYNAIHYLLKPINPIELVVAINRIKLQKEPKPDHSASSPMIRLSTRIGTQMVPINDIIYMESQGSYTNVNLTDEKTILIAKTIKDISEKLVPYPQFIRVHRSFLVNRNYMSIYLRSGLLELNNKTQIPVSDKYKSIVAQLFT